MDQEKFYITNAKYKSLEEELRYLEVGEGSMLLAKLLASSPGSGMGRPNDLPAHVLAGELLGYVQEIKSIIRKAVIIDEIREQEDDVNKVILGSTVYVQYDEDDEIEEYTILGQKEADMRFNRISCFSPIGSALIGKRKGENVIANLTDSNRLINMKLLDVKRNSLEFDYGVSTWKERLERALMMET